MLAIIAGPHRRSPTMALDFALSLLVKESQFDTWQCRDMHVDVQYNMGTYRAKPLQVMRDVTYSIGSGELKTKALSVFSSIHNIKGNRNDLHHNRLPL